MRRGFRQGREWKCDKEQEGYRPGREINVEKNVDQDEKGI